SHMIELVDAIRALRLNGLISLMSSWFTIVAAFVVGFASSSLLWTPVARRLRHQNLVDDLTGIWNRRGAVEILQQIDQRRRGHWWMILLDLTDFSSVNNNFGHD